MEQVYPEKVWKGSESLARLMEGVPPSNRLVKTGRGDLLLQCEAAIYTFREHENSRKHRKRITVIIQ